jgi:hypothetical protein
MTRRDFLAQSSVAALVPPASRGVVRAEPFNALNALDDATACAATGPAPRRAVANMRT